ncbi:protein-export chaperone SecB [Pseudaquidulcibacter saccharophilus]|uniref:protein-export chaperone SecB n=1 Tax=Pseudaquidulcibacter saccharophilus TaxID=2831900 RepID=UPI001EFF4EF7|nr:protein-export chaperone SecB [Pseudaquidulcibacter saccharophilus]
MSDENQPIENGAAPEALQAVPSVHVLAQYIKDFSFENPNSPASLREGAQPKIDLQLDVSARGMEDPSVFEVDLKINAKSEREGQVLFVTELVYSGLFQFNNIPQENLEPMLLIEAPRTLFPFARQIVADATRNGGYPPLMIDPMDFASLYMAQRQGQQDVGNA